MGGLWKNDSVLLVILHFIFVKAATDNSECPHCHLCPIDKPYCCITNSGDVIANGDYVFKMVASYDGNTCVDTKCVNGEFKREYYCPLGYKSIGTACYHIGSKRQTFQDAKKYCEQLGPARLAVLDTEEKATSLEGEIDQYLSDTEHSANQEGLVWLGTTDWNNEDVSWLNGNSLKDTYNNLKTYQGTNGHCVSAYSIKHNLFDYRWYFVDQHAFLYPLCERTYCERVVTCHYEDVQYSPGEIMWRDPNCECTWIECGDYGQIKAITKKKPCCTYNGVVYGNKETVYEESCVKMVCEKGRLVSYPNCQQGFIPVTYNGSASCYLISSHEMTHNEATRYCALHDSKLAEITSVGENEAVENHAINTYRLDDMWLGARADLCENGKPEKMHWTSLESLDRPLEVVYQDFCEGQPSQHSGANCLYTSFTKEKYSNYWCWANASCKEKKYALCEKCALCEHTNTIGAKEPAKQVTPDKTSPPEPVTASSSFSSTSSSSSTSTPLPTSTIESSDFL